MLNENTQNVITIVVVILGFILGGGGILVFAKYLRSNPDKANALEAAIAGLTASVPAETMKELSKTIATIADLAKVFAGLIDRVPGIDPETLSAQKVVTHVAASDGTSSTTTTTTTTSSTSDVSTKELPPYQADKPEGSG